MGFKKWVIGKTDKQLAKQLSEICEIEPILALIAAARGHTDPSELEQFFSDELCLSDAYLFTDIEKAAEIVNKAIENGEKIAVYGDYDCDGVTATALLYKYLKSRNADCVYYIPDRFSEGYGMNCNAVKHLSQKGVELIITVDNGISCVEEIELANSLGMKVVITDHHLPPEIIPKAVAVVDPHRVDCPSDFKSLCGAQIAFMLVCVLENKEPEELLPYFSDLISVAVIADVMPLIGENRSIVKHGIFKLKSSPLTGLSAILNVSGVALSNVNAEKIAFSICPRINAAGRMGNAAKAVELLCENNMLKALEIANEIDELNALRQQTERTIMREAVQIIEKNKLFNDRVIVVCGDDWHHGVVGIVASRICERYGKPAIVLSSDGEVSHGSGRSYDGFSLFNSVSFCKDLLTKFGGHDLACGLTLATDNVSDFRKKINEYAFSVEYQPPILKLDCKLNPAALTVELSESLKLLQPFGFKNQLPVFGIFGVTLQRITPLSDNKHLKLLFSKDVNKFQALLFGVSTESFCFDIGNVLDLAVTLETNNYNGNVSVSVQIKAMRMSDTDDTKLFDDIENYGLMINNKSFNAVSIAPTRTEIGTIYRYIGAEGILSEKIKYHFINTLGYGKTAVSLDVLTELKLIYFENGRYFKNPAAEKTDLSNSDIFNKVTGSVNAND